MYFKQKSNVLFRNYGSYGYLTDNRNFGYKLLNSEEKHIGDKVLSESGAVFLSVLGRKAQTLDELAIRIKHQFPDTDIITIKKDAKEFYSILEKDGFIVSGKTSQECDKKDIRFSYSRIAPQKTGNSTLINKKPKRSTQDFLEEYHKGKPLLTNLHIEITSTCNERCLHCYIPHENKTSSIDPSLFYEVLDQCKKMKLLHITISGGEPMLHKNFRDFLKKCKEYDFSVNVLSNLTLLNDEIIQEMRSNPLLGVQVSLYSMNPEIHDNITQTKGSFEKTKNAILKLLENDVPLQISCPIIKHNKDCYKDVIEWAKNHGIFAGDDYIIIARHNHTTHNLSCRLSISEIEELILDKIENDSKYLEQIEIEAKENQDIKPNDFVCSVCDSTLCISDNGNVYPCAGWQDFVVGNVKENSINDIWQKSPKVKYLRNLRKKDFPKCIQCTDKEFCTMCMVRNANEDHDGNPLVVNEYFCNIAKLNKKLTLLK